MKVMMDQWMEMAIRAALDAGAAIMDARHAGNFGSWKKHDGSPVTDADRSSHQILADRLATAGLPVLSEEGEQVPFRERRNWDFFWLIDPLDGTIEFIEGREEFTVNIGLVNGNHPVMGVIFVPSSGTLYYGTMTSGVFRQQNGKTESIHVLKERRRYADIIRKEEVSIVASRSHLTSETREWMRRFPNSRVIQLGSSLKFTWLLEGRADIYPRLETTMEWDTAAGHALLNASNRGVYQLNPGKELTYNGPDLANPGFIAF